MRSSAKVDAPKEKVYVVLNIGCLDWDYPESNIAAVVVKTRCPRREALSVCLAWKQMPALQPQGCGCFATGGCLGSSWRRVATKTI